MSEKAVKLLDTLDVKVCYLKFFDVDWDSKEKEVIPIGRSIMNFDLSGTPKRIELIPTIFITNEVFKNLNNDQLNSLAHNIYRKTQLQFNSMFATSSGNSFEPPRGEPSSGPFKMTYDDLTWPTADTVTDMHSAFENVKEIQIDCDWTESTREKYFYFLKVIKKQFKNKLISCTIRMYPYKYPSKAGVPPVDKGMLMIYNVGDVTKVESGNSIFDKEEVMKYLNGKEVYPLKLDYAFPIFEWLSVYRNGKLIKLLPINASSYLNPDYTKVDVTQKNNTITRYKINEEIIMDAYSFSLQKGDEVKCESIDYADVTEIASKISSINTNQSPNITLFQFDYANVEKHQKEILKIYSRF